MHTLPKVEIPCPVDQDWLQLHRGAEPSVHLLSQQQRKLPTSPSPVRRKGRSEGYEQHPLTHLVLYVEVSSSFNQYFGLFQPVVLGNKHQSCLPSLQDGKKQTAKILSFTPIYW